MTNVKIYTHLKKPNKILVKTKCRKKLFLKTVNVNSMYSTQLNVSLLHFEPFYQLKKTYTPIHSSVYMIKRIRPSSEF